MFDIGFTELLVIAVVALLVLGPERLPKAARIAGLWVRRARAQWYSVRSELERELASEELKRSLHDAQARREFDDMREQARAIAAARAPAAVTPTDRRESPGYEPEPETDDATVQARDDDDARRA
jgi:sec-independent protein translocase protein TatB